MDFPPLFLLGRALRAAHLGNSDMRSFGTATVVARVDRTALAAYVRAPVETSPEVLLELLGVEPVAVVRVMAWDRGGVPWLTCTLRSDASHGPDIVTVDIPPGCMHLLPHIVAATEPDRVEISRHPLGGLHVELTVDQADRLTTTLLSAAAPSAEPGEQGTAS
ncbi:MULTISPECIES: hypothetical protein [Streptomyces]|uniref:hypothetical protein n=1 Tax=Streptomyces TaxID=1883 RepID=UPI000EF8F870|nr:hypothetical protein [Streptomyces sp. S5]